MDNKYKKIIGLSIIAVIFLIVSIFFYGKSKSEIFKEDYMSNIFEEEEFKEISTNEDENLNDEYSYDEKNLIYVEIKGEVVNPDVYEIKEGSIVRDLIEKAGGLTEEADITNINRAKELQNHELIIISNINDENNIQVSSATSSTSSNELININTADEEELTKITGIGPSKAASIISYREANGGFKTLDELKNVDGIGDKTFEKIKELITL